MRIRRRDTGGGSEVKSGGSVLSASMDQHSEANSIRHVLDVQGVLRYSTSISMSALVVMT
jgi:hypothetical protein